MDNEFFNIFRSIVIIIVIVGCVLAGLKFIAGKEIKFQPTRNDAPQTLFQLIWNHH